MAMFQGYGGTGPAYDEMFDGDTLRPPYLRLRESLEQMTTPELVSRVEALQASYLDQGVTFDIGGEERAFPLDILPRVIEQDTWSTMEAGVQQRVKTLELFLADVYLARVYRTLHMHTKACRLEIVKTVNVLVHLLLEMF